MDSSEIGVVLMVVGICQLIWQVRIFILTCASGCMIPCCVDVSR